MKTIKDVPRGTANCNVLGEGRDPSDFAHVSQSSPIALKRKELTSTEGYRTEIAPDINEAREKETSRKRLTNSKGVKPI